MHSSTPLFFIVVGSTSYLYLIHVAVLWKHILPSLTFWQTDCTTLNVQKMCSGKDNSKNPQSDFTSRYLATWPVYTKIWVSLPTNICCVFSQSSNERYCYLWCDNIFCKRFDLFSKILKLYLKHVFQTSTTNRTRFTPKAFLYINLFPVSRCLIFWDHCLNPFK